MQIESNNNKYNIEVCIDSVESAIEAEKGGATRLELCDSLVIGGTTPSKGLIDMVIENTNLDTFVMIRPRGGDFCYSDFEFEIMKRDIEIAKESGAKGIVFGILNSDGTVDIERCKELIDISRPLPVTFHRAFDMTVNPFRAIEDLIELGIDRILTSGQKNSALEGSDIIKELQSKYKDKIVIMAGAGVTHENGQIIMEKCNINEIHLSAKCAHESKMIYRNTDVCMGGGRIPSEYELYYSDAEKIHKLRESIENSHNK